jgi:hypothetical protein
VFTQDTPSSVLYQDLKTFGGISNKDAARILLSGKVAAGGRAPRDRVDDRTFLSREVVHSQPGLVNTSLFANLPDATQTLMSRLLANRATGGKSGILAHYLGPASQAMQETLADYNLDAAVYRNEVLRLGSVRLRREEDRATLVLMLFVSTGCLADPAAAVGVVEGFAVKTLAVTIGTIETTMGDQAESAPESTVDLGLLRFVNGTARPPIHPLSPAGSIVGSLATGPGAVTDVDVDVSRRHLRIWRQGTRWLCQGLGSTNGTLLVSGADKSTTVVEPPRSGRRASEYPPVPIERGDMLCLGRTTRFLVMNIQARS